MSQHVYEIANPATHVEYTPQVLTSEQKEQARDNIGASDFSGRYEDLTGQPTFTWDASTSTLSITVA